MNSKTRSTSQRALNNPSSRTGNKVDFIKKNKEQILRIPKRNRSSSSSRSRKISPKNQAEVPNTQPQPKITNLKEARDRAKLKRISEADSVGISQEFENTGDRGEHRLSYSQPQRIDSHPDISTEDELHLESLKLEDKTENRQNMNTIREETTDSIPQAEDKISTNQMQHQSDEEEDVFLKTFGSSQHSRSSSSAKTETPSMQPVYKSYTQKHLTDYHGISAKPILRSAKKEDTMKQINITHYIPGSKQTEEQEQFYDAVDETNKLNEENLEPTHIKQRESSELDMILETPFNISHANIIQSQNSGMLNLHDSEDDLPVDMELEVPQPLHYPSLEVHTPSQISSSLKLESDNTSYSQAHPEPSEITIPASRKKSISFDIPEPQPSHTPSQTPSYVHKATPYPHTSQPHLYDLRSEPFIYHSQQHSLQSHPASDSDRKTVHTTPLYNIPEIQSLNDIQEHHPQTAAPLDNKEQSYPSSVLHTPEPIHLQPTPESQKENSDPTFRNINYDKMPMSEQIKRSARRVKITDTGEEIPDVTWTELKMKLSSTHPNETEFMENIKVSEFKLEDISQTEKQNLQNMKRLSFSQPPEEIQLQYTPDKETISIQTSPVHSNQATPLRRSARLAAKRRNVIDHTEHSVIEPSEQSGIEPSEQSGIEPSEQSERSESQTPLSESENEPRSITTSLKRKLNSGNFTDFDVPAEAFKEYYGMVDSSRSNKKMKYR